MSASKVYFTDLRTSFNENLPQKLERLIKTAGIGQIDFNNKFAAIKIHFGEPGNLAYLRPNYAAVGGQGHQGTGRQTVPDRLQHPVCRRTQKCPGPTWTQPIPTAFLPSPPAAM